MRTIIYSLILIFSLLACNAAFADVRLPAIFGNHMVMQQNTTVNIWGWANPAENVTVVCDWDTTKYTAKTSRNADWQLSIKTIGPGKSHIIKITAGNTVQLSDVVFGEVWVCSGQSNMEMTYNWGMPQYAQDTAAAANDAIRFFYVPKRTAEYPEKYIEGSWVVSTPGEMKNFSAAGYFFGKQLNDKLQVPIGLIDASWGGTPAETWTPARVVSGDTVLKRSADSLKLYDWWPSAPGYAYNAMIYPISNFPIAGVIWYQGEANVSTWYGYHQLFTAMIGAWRKQWRKDFPFYFVQIAPFAGYGKGNASALLREAQTESANYPNTGMVVTSDLVDNINDIHPKMKKEVGTRLANYALAQTYGMKDLPYKSPQYKNMKIEGNKVRVYLDDAADGLMLKGKVPTDFYIAGSDKKFLPAQAKLEKNTVVVWNKDVTHPAAVRFGFTNAAMPNLFSKDGLPVNSFRTDDWNVDTINN